MCRQRRSLPFNHLLILFIEYDANNVLPIQLAIAKVHL